MKALIRLHTITGWSKPLFLACNIVRFSLDMGLVVRKSVFKVCEQQRRRPACASAQNVSAFVFRILVSIISNFATSEIEETGLSLALSEAPKTGFVTTRPISKMINQTIQTLSCISLFSDTPETIRAPNMVTIDCCIRVIPNERADSSVDRPTVSMTLWNT